MKNIIKTLVIIATVGFIASACGDEKFDIQDGGSFAEGISPAQDLAFIWEVTKSVSFSTDVSQNGVGLTSVTGTKVMTVGGVESASSTLDLTGGTFSQDLTELFADVPVDGVILTEDDLNPGDKWTITYVMVASDGRELVSPYTTVINFACPSDVPTDATWTGATQDGAFGVFSTNAAISITANGGTGLYSLTDVTGGFYTAFGPTWNENQSVSIKELCKFVEITESDAQIVIATTADTGKGSWDDVNQVLTIPWHDTTNDFVETTVFTIN